MTATAAGGGGAAPKKKLDKALAQEVVTQATAAMQMLANQTPGRVSKGRLALHHWSGPDAEQFRGHFSSMQKEAQTLHGQLQALIRQVNAAIDAG